MQTRVRLTITAFVVLLVSVMLSPVFWLRSEAVQTPAVAVVRANLPRVLPETDTPERSPDPEWWLNSGGQFFFTSSGFGSTLHGSLPRYAWWRLLYAVSNPRDTDRGLYPQNLFRLISRRHYTDVQVATTVRISDIHLTDTPYRNESNGVLLMARYLDSDNLYYGGVRVDGHAVIKKKINGQYLTLAEEPLVINRHYDRRREPSLLPYGQPFSFRFVADNTNAGVVLTLQLYDRERGWRTVLTALDDGEHGEPHRAAGAVGVRADFMDVIFDELSIEPL